jgi:NAD(P)-dependent dehydrogenase (short-subunit alcohol dehydrogenase family)
MNRLDGKIALLSGAARGIGAETARLMVEAGAAVAIGDVLDERGRETVRALEEAGGKAVYLHLDVTRESDWAAAIEAVVARFGGLDILVNNAQEVPLGKLDDVTDQAFTAGFVSGPLAAMRLMKLARPHMAARGGGTIFNFCSSAGIRWDMSGYGAYGAVKQAIRALTRAAAAEWGSEGIRVLTIAPHAASPGLMWWIENNPEEAEAFFRTIPLGRVGELEQDIGRALVALCGQDLAYLTGATIPLDGGQANFD